MFVTRAQRASFAAGRHRFLPLSYYGFAEHLRTLEFDQAWIQVAPARANGSFRLGLNADYADVVRRMMRRGVNAPRAGFIEHIGASRRG